MSTKIGSSNSSSSACRPGKRLLEAASSAVDADRLTHSHLTNWRTRLTNGTRGFQPQIHLGEPRCVSCVCCFWSTSLPRSFHYWGPTLKAPCLFFHAIGPPLSIHRPTNHHRRIRATSRTVWTSGTDMGTPNQAAQTTLQRLRKWSPHILWRCRDHPRPFKVLSLKTPPGVSSGT